MTKRAYKDPGVQMVAEFHDAFGCAHEGKPWIPTLGPADRGQLLSLSDEILSLGRRLKAQAAEANGLGRKDLGLMLIRLQLLVEETGELARGIGKRDLVEVLDALSDISYVTDGAYLTFGMGGCKPAADAEVHRSNMSKLGADGRPIVDASGRVVKSAVYTRPELGQIVRDAILAEKWD